MTDNSFGGPDNSFLMGCHPSIQWLLLAQLVGLASSVVVCGPGFTCPDGNTCCPTGPGGDHRHPLAAGLVGDGAARWACCADEEPGKGVCCGDGRHCCANGYTCELSSGTCAADEPKVHPLATRTNLYSLCPADIPTTPHEFTGLVSSSPLSLPYYSSPGPLGEPNTEAQIAVIVVHGSVRLTTFPLHPRRIDLCGSCGLTATS
eukprot:COSAG02_NODE_2979_length_7625_cov_73.716715_5_plen_204_part_00